MDAKSIRRKYAIRQYYKNKKLKELGKDEEPSGEHDNRRGQNHGNYHGRGDRRGGRGYYRGRGRRGRAGRGRGGIIQDGFMHKDDDDDKREGSTGELLLYLFGVRYTLLGTDCTVQFTYYHSKSC